MGSQASSSPSLSSLSSSTGSDRSVGLSTEERLRRYEDCGVTYFQKPPKTPCFTGRPHQLKKWDHYINVAVNTTGGLEIFGEDEGIYGDKDELVRRVFKKFNIKVIKESKLLVDGESDIFFCLCEEGVFIFGDNFSTGAMISRDISRLLTFLDSHWAASEGFLKKAGEPYFVGIAGLDECIERAWRRDYVFASPEKLTYPKQNHDLKEWDSLLKYLESLNSSGVDALGKWEVYKNIDELAAEFRTPGKRTKNFKEIASMIARTFKLTAIPYLKVAVYLDLDMRCEYILILLEEGVFHLDYLISPMTDGPRIRLCSTSISGMLTNRTENEVSRGLTNIEGPWKRTPYFPKNYIPGQAVSEFPYSRGDKTTWNRFGRYMAKPRHSILKTPSYWKMLEQDSYGDKENLAKTLEKFGLTIIRGSTIVQMRGENRAICICTSGVYEIKPQNCTFISTTIAGAIVHFRAPEALVFPVERSSQSLESTPKATRAPDTQDIIPNPQGIDKVISTLLQSVKKDLGTWEGVVELWGGFVKEMSTAGWVVVKKSPDYIHDIETQDSFQNYSITLIKDTQMLQDPSTKSIVLLSTVGVLQFGLHFKYFHLISSSIPKALRYFSAPVHERKSEKGWVMVERVCEYCFPKEKLSISQLVGRSSGPPMSCGNCLEDLNWQRGDRTSA